MVFGLLELSFYLDKKMKKPKEEKHIIYKRRTRPRGYLGPTIHENEIRVHVVRDACKKRKS